MSSPIERMIDEATGYDGCKVKPIRNNPDKRAEALLEIADRSMEWFERKKPRSWTEEKHLENPEVNCKSSVEIGLARAVSEWIKLGG